MIDLRSIFLQEDVAVDIMHIQLFAWVKKEIGKRHLSQIISCRTANSKSTASQYIYLWEKQRLQEPIRHYPAEDITDYNQILIRISDHTSMTKREAYTINILVSDDGVFDYPDIDQVKEIIIQWMESCRRFQRKEGKG